MKRINKQNAGTLLIISIIALSNASAWNIAARVTGISETLGTPKMLIATAGALLAGILVGLAITFKHKKIEN